MEIPFKIKEPGLYVEAGDFFIDASSPVAVCVVTHAHGDHAYFGHGLYIATSTTIKIMKQRFGTDIPCKALEYGEKLKLGNVWISLHPAGHILGSSQVKIEYQGITTVISGDYKRSVDTTCEPFEVIECDIFVTESTFALPIYQWPNNEIIKEQMLNWWQENANQQRPSVIFGYALGKAQRILSLVKDHSIGKIYCHGAILYPNKIYQDAGIELPDFYPVADKASNQDFSKSLILAPPSAFKSPWMRRFPSCRTSFASGWMEVRGARRRRAVDTGFTLSDHADFKALIQTIEETKAKLVFTTHGNADTLARYLQEQKNIDAKELKGLSNLEESED